MRKGETFDEWWARTEARHAKIEASPHFVYRAFDSYGLLLYVGCSLNVERRLAAHRSTSQWHRYAETVGISGPYSKVYARQLETEGIETEAPYFACSVGDAKRTRANIQAARRAMANRGDIEPSFDLDRYERDGDAWYDTEYAPLENGWRRRFERMRESLKATSHPYMTDADRLARYLAAREDAERARTEVA